MRAVAMKPTDGMQRGMEATDLGPSRLRCRWAPARSAAYERARRAGRFPGPARSKRKSAGRSIAPPPTLENQSTELKMFETGIKVVDLLEPYLQGGKIGLFGGAGVGKTVVIMELIQQHRHEARRRLGVRRRRRTHARRQRPVARVPGERRHRHQRLEQVARGARLRTDDGAAGRAAARRSVGADGGRVLPRRGRQGRAALHRQHLPVHAGRLRSVGAARPHAVGGRLPADAAERDGRAAGAHHVDEERLDHVGAGDLRAGRRLHRSGAGDDLRASRRDDEPVAADRGAGHLSGGRSAGVELAHSRPARHRRRSTTTWRAR